MSLIVVYSYVYVFICSLTAFPNYSLLLLALFLSPTQTFLLLSCHRYSIIHPLLLPPLLDLTTF